MLPRCKKFLIKKGTARKNVEAHNHRVNAAEPAVKTEKYHIIAHIATLDHQCPIKLWSKMLPQMQDKLNMLRTSRNNNTLTFMKNSIVSLTGLEYPKPHSEQEE